MRVRNQKITMNNKNKRGGLLKKDSVTSIFLKILRYYQREISFIVAEFKFSLYTVSLNQPQKLYAHTFYYEKSNRNHISHCDIYSVQVFRLIFKFASSSTYLYFKKYMQIPYIGGISSPVNRIIFVSLPNPTSYNFY